MENREFFENVKRWSQRKHRLLGKYLPPYSAKVARTTPRREIYVVDGFAGAAVYDDGSKGSPVLIAEFGDKCQDWRNPVTLQLINVERDARSEGIFESLQRETEKWVLTNRVRNIKKDFGEAVPEILSLIGGAPGLFFIDPIGPTSMRFEALRPILFRSAKVTELIINFDQDGLRRIVDAAFSPNTDPKTAVTNAKNVTEILGSARWQSRIEGKNLSSRDAERILLEEYCANLANYGFAVVAYPIREALDANPKYNFIYCTRHADGLMLMNDFVREEEDQLYGEHIGDNFPLFTSEATTEVESRKARLRIAVTEYLHQHTDGFTRGKLRADLVVRAFGHFHGKDYTAVVQELLKAGVIRANSGKTRINDDEILRVA